MTFSRPAKIVATLRLSNYQNMYKHVAIAILNELRLLLQSYATYRGQAQLFCSLLLLNLTWVLMKKSRLVF